MIALRVVRFYSIELLGNFHQMSLIVFAELPCLGMKLASF